MLRFLRIRNLAVIEAVEVEFDSGFNVLTGETGAGKSILVEAVGLLLGARASADLVRTGEAQATIEAIFEGLNGQELIVRREISNQGRSRSFLNGALATASALRDLAARMVELHGQHEHQALLDPLSHLPLLDEYAELGDVAGRVAAAWTKVRTLREQLERSRMDAREKSARLDLIAFQLGEIEKSVPKAGEDEELAATKQVLASAERIQRLCQESYSALYDSDDAVLAGLGGVWKRVGELATIEPQFAPYVESRDAIKSQLEDLAYFLRSYADGIDASPARLQQVEDRLALLERLKRKYGPTLQDVIDKGESLLRERELLTGAGESAEHLAAALDEASNSFLAAARDLSRKRRGAAVKFAREIEALLAELAMGRTRFEVRFNDGELPPEAWNERGIDEAEFFVSPNPGEDLRPLARIVSGGELSRIMLALKTLAAGDTPGKTLIFDEVDAGIGGRVADVVGARLQALGERFQVLCITHLPQIAARGTTQFLIEKSVRGARTATRVDRLDDAGRVEEVARMIGGASVTEQVRASARELLQVGAGFSRPEAKGERRKRKSSIS
ncbi:MAG TPA: DNA repair protein RecN [Vicinamibacterales bacterium]|jgi:DNA repair protein RecN (Recombination protein N)|nr:DNA repair protein RecN [Vicinamibacterales bacterium]